MECKTLENKVLIECSSIIDVGVDPREKINLFVRMSDEQISKLKRKFNRINKLKTAKK